MCVLVKNTSPQAMGGKTLTNSGSAELEEAGFAGSLGQIRSGEAAVAS